MTSDEPPIQIRSHGKIDEQGKIPETTFKIKEMNLKAGLLGKFFGGMDNAPTNICGMLVLCLVITGALLSFCEAKIEPMEYWKSVLPVVTAVLGYLFGKGHK